MSCASSVEGERAGSSQYNQNQEYEPFHLSECRVFLTDRSLRGCNKVVFFPLQVRQEDMQDDAYLFLDTDDERGPNASTQELHREKIDSTEIDVAAEWRGCRSRFRDFEFQATRVCG